MQCTKCGAAVNGGAGFCPACGTPVPANGTPVAANQAAPAGVAVPNYMVWSILSTLFCCLIGGIVAIVYSSKVNTKLAQGDIEGAKAASKAAKGWNIANLVVGFVLPVLFILATAIPNFMKYRGEAQANTCISNMKQIQAAVEQTMMAGTAKPTNTTCPSGVWAMALPSAATDSMTRFSNTMSSLLCLGIGAKF